MSARGRSTSPHPLRDEDVEMDTVSNDEKVDLGNSNSNGVDKPDAKVVIVTNLTRNVVQEHLQTIFGFYGEIIKLDLPLFGKCAFPTLILCPILVLGLMGHSSRSKPRQSSIGILRRRIGSKSLLPHERWSTRWSNTQSRTLRPSNSSTTRFSFTSSPHP